MSASGKTTIGKRLYEQLTLSGEKWVFLDGDVFRNILEEDLGHSIKDRRKNAYRISRFCEFLNSQGVNVLACVLSIFHSNQKYNKSNIDNYKEVYIEVDFDKLLKRDNKELYRKALQGEIKDVVGVDIKFTPPFSPDLIIDNNETNADLEKITNKIIEEFGIDVNKEYKYTKTSLLERPHKYEYSKFEGNSFFLGHKKDREGAVIFLKDRLAYLKENSVKSGELRCNTRLSDEHIVLKDFLVKLLQGNELKKQKNTILTLIKRFEVGKKLYSTYDSKEIRKNTQKFKQYINYPLFSLVLQRYYEGEAIEEKKLIYLNAILKVNDILSSIRQDIIIPLEIEYSIKAFNAELAIARTFYD